MDEFNEQFELIMNMFANGVVFALATENNHQPSVRSISGFSLNNKIYFQTDMLMEKANEIKDNPKVAISYEGIQIKGICTEIGRLDSIENKWFSDLFKVLFPNAYKKYSHVETERIYEIEPLLIKSWGDKDGIPCIRYIDVCDKKCRITVYEEYKKSE